MTREQFNERYWAAQPPEVRKFQQYTDGRVDIGLPESERERIAIELALNGFAMDAWIHVWGWSPYESMSLRKRHGYTWWPTILQPGGFDLAPGIIGMPGSPYDPNRPLPGSIKISVNPDDYPPFDRVEDATEPPAIPQGIPMPVVMAGRYRGVMVGDNSPSGAKWTDPQGLRVWVKKIRGERGTPFFNAWWELEGE